MFSLVLQIVRKIIVQFFSRICSQTRLGKSWWLKNAGRSHGRSSHDGGRVRTIIIPINKLIILIIFHENTTYRCARSISDSGKVLYVYHCSLISSFVISSGRAFLQICNCVKTLWEKKRWKPKSFISFLKKTWSKSFPLAVNRKERLHPKIRQKLIIALHITNSTGDD